jgi:glutathione peroxidase
LQSGLDQIKESGINVVAVSYDSQEILNKFASKNGIQFPLLSDPESKVIRQFGLVNGAAKEGSRKFQISHPMTVMLNKDATVAGVIPETVRDRHTAEGLIEAWGKVAPAADEGGDAAEALSFKMEKLNGEEVSLGDYKGKVIVMVNVASKCGYTKQYAPLQKLYDDHKDDGLVVLGFPCNQFGGQEPGSPEEIKEFCQENYGVTFDMFAKIDVKGDDAAPLYKHLTAQDTKPKAAGAVRWNFEKFVIDRDGKVAGRFGSGTSPDSDEFMEVVKKLIGEK